MAKYTYKLAIGAASGELFVPDKDAIYTWKEESNTAGFMRKNIKDLIITKDYDDGSGTRPNADIFDTLWEYYFDDTKQTTEIVITIYKDDVLDYTGLFYINDGDIDVNNGVYTIRAVVDDIYRKFLLLIDEDVNIIDGEGEYTANELLYVGELESFNNGLPTAPTNAVDGSPLPDLWISNGSVWSRRKSQYYAFPFVTPVKYGDHWYYGQLTSLIPPESFPNCFKLTDSIQLILDTIGSELTFRSVFFNHNSAISGVINYVTGTLNTLQNTLIEQNSDTKDPDAPDKATLGKISFSNLMEDLASMFNVRWYIDDDGYLRIEHEKFFYNGTSFTTKTVGIHLTDEAKYTDASSHKLYIEDTQDYVSADIEPNKSETIQFANGAKAPDFRDDLNYLSYTVIKSVVNIKKHIVGNLSTDIVKVRNFPEEISDDGFHIFNCWAALDPPTDPKSFGIVRKAHDYTLPNDTVANAGFSPKWLLYAYYEYGRQDKSGELITDGDVSATPYEVLSTVPIYLQKDIVFLLNNADNIDINKYIATYLIKVDGAGTSSTNTVNGSIVEIEHDLETDFVTATLGYEL